MPTHDDGISPFFNARELGRDDEEEEDVDEV
jgi:hypothetical protein